MSYTPEPWGLGDSDMPVSALAICAGNSKHVTIGRLVSSEDFDAFANARRIVACVNALKNVSTEWLETQGDIVCLGSPIKGRFLELEKQRDELLAICEELQECAEYWSEYFVPLGIVERLDAAIAKVKGGAA